MDQTDGSQKRVKDSHIDRDGPVDVCSRMLPQSGWGMFGGQEGCLARETQRKVNDYFGVVPTAGAAVSLLDNLKMCKLKKKA